MTSMILNKFAFLSVQPWRYDRYWIE